MVRLRSIGVLSCAKVCAIVQGIVGAIVGIIIILAGSAGLPITPFHHHGSGFLGLVLLALCMTVCYAVIGFLAGAIGSAIYNWVAEAIGGLELELESLVPTPAQPSGSYSAGA